MTLSRSPNLAEVLRAAMDNRLADVHVALPGQVEKYDLATQSADIKPLIKRRVETDGDDLIESLPVIPKVPIVFPRAGGFFISMPIKKGDLVTLIFCERSIDKYTAGKGKDTDPVDLRMHELIDAVAFPGFYPFSESLEDAHADNLVIGEDGGKHIHVKSGEIALGVEAPADWVALASLVKTELQAIINTFNAHIHTTTATIGPSAVVGIIAPPTIAAAAAADVKSATVKSE